jgi:hypothetical protein
MDLLTAWALVLLGMVGGMCGTMLFVLRRPDQADLEMLLREARARLPASAGDLSLRITRALGDA